MTATLMGRLFVVPALVVCVLIGVAVVVVFFGASSLETPKSIEDLLARIESDSGDRTMGMLLPGAKESWQAAQELARRLEQKDRFLKSDEVAPVAQRIIGILAKMPANRSGEMNTSEDARRGQARKLFLMTALGQLETPLAIEPLAGYLSDGDPLTRQVALQSIARMGKVPQIGRLLPRIYPLLDDQTPAVQMITCLTVASLADKGDKNAIQKVAEKLESDREIQWNAAMALARMGSRRGKAVLMNMLDRSFWQGIKLDYQENNTHIMRGFTEAEVAYRLRAAVSAASRLDDTELNAIINRLSQKDTSPGVRDAAIKATEKMKSKHQQSSTLIGFNRAALTMTIRGGVV